MNILRVSFSAQSYAMELRFNTVLHNFSSGFLLFNSYFYPEGNGFYILLSKQMVVDLKLLIVVHLDKQSSFNFIVVSTGS